MAESSASADSLLLDLTVGIVVVDPRYYILRINSAARQMLGIHGTAYDQDFVHLAEVLPPSAIRAAIDSALAGKTTTAVFEVEPTDAASETTHFVEATVRPYRVEDARHRRRRRRTGGRDQTRSGSVAATSGRGSDSRRRSPRTAGSFERTRS